MIKKVSSIFFLLLSFLMLMTSSLSGQNYVGESIKSFDNAEYLKEQFKKYEVFELDIDGINKYVSGAGSDFDLNLQLDESYDWKMSLAENDLKRTDFKVLVGNRGGVKEQSFNKVITFSGYLKSGGTTRMTINDGFLYGLIERGNKTYFLEPLKHFNQEAKNSLFVVYEFADVKEVKGKTCGATDFMNKKNEIDQQIHNHDHDHGTEGKSMVCYDVDIRLAADWSMNVKHGGVTGTVTYMMGVLNNVATNYDNEFNDNLILLSGGNFVSNCSSCDPWTSSTSASTLLSSFRTWGQGNGFGTTDFEAATLWTNRNLDGSTIGIAWVGAVCTSFKYNVCQDFTSSSAFLRVLQAHELGHNFSSSHDASGSAFIMAPSVNSSTTWSTASRSSINSFVSNAASGGCFNSCGSGPPPPGSPPVTDFTVSPSTPICPGNSVSFSDISTNSPTSWSWSFPGGSPSSSSLQNPSVTYASSGSYNVTLTATNASGNDSETKVNVVVVTQTPVAAFGSTTNNNIATFSDASNGIPSSWFWDFGDGSTSTDQNPIHPYTIGGTYVVTLTATNSCGSNSVTNTVTVGNPSSVLNADFTSNHSNPVCVGETVNFVDISTGILFGHSWSFPGGTPSFASVPNPSVTYNSPGTYDVSLTILSPLGFANEVKVGYVVVTNAAPNANFSFTSNNNFFNFTDQSSNANTWLWEFGDGSTSSLQNPSHTYANSGTYQVRLTASNGCGSDVQIRSVTATGGGTAPTANFTSNHNNPACSGTINFTNTSSGNPTSYSWSFPGGNPSTSSSTNPTINYSTPGTYNVTLTATNANGSDTETKSNFVVVANNPTANFTSSTNNLIASFTNSSSNASSYSWNFGDGSTSTATNPTHNYSAAGTYTVTLVASNSCGSNTSSQSVTVSAAPAGPTANFTSNHSNPICSGTVVNFTSTSSGNPTSFSWLFPGGSPSSSTLQNPTVTYNTPGSRNVTLTVTNANGSDTETKSGYVVISANPNANFNTTTTNLTATFTNTSTAASSFTWNFGDGNTSSATSPTHTYSVGGTYTVTLTANSNCGSDNTSQVVTVSAPPPGPTANFTSNHSNPICGGTVVNFTSTSSGNPTSYNWSFPGGIPSSSTLQNPTVTYNTPGSRNVTLTVSNVGGSDTETKINYVVVASGPSANFASSANFNTVSFTNNSSNAVSYAWNFGDGNTSNATNPTHTYASAGTYSVSLVATNSCGNNTRTRSVTVTLPGVTPTANFTSGHTNPLCAGSSVSFTNTSSGNPTSYSWSFLGGSPSTSTALNPTVTYNTPGTYSVTLTASNSTGTDTKTESGFVVVTSTGPSVLFSNSSVGGTSIAFQNLSTGGATSYSWDFGDGMGSSTDENPVYQYPWFGIFYVQFTASNACGSSTFSSYVFVSGGLLTGIDDLDNFESLNVFPNPSNGQFTVEAKGVSAKQMRFSILNNLGQVLHNDIEDFTSGYLRKDFQIELAKGMYFIQMEIEGEKVLRKLQIH